jgi:YebC/PmpR family DNA-binding regulatory protein
MSGHSKWHNIQAHKGKQDAKRSNEFTKLARLIAVAAQKGGDPNMNFSLRMAIEKAKYVSMPKDNIERAIKRGTGADGEGIRIEEVLYEAYGPGGTAILIKVVTDNKNRAISDIKHVLNIHEGNLGAAGSVQWMFHQWGVVTIPMPGNIEEFELNLIEAGAEDIKENGEILEIRTQVDHFQKVLHWLKENNIVVEEASLEWIAKDQISVSTEIEAKLNNLFGALEESDDVENYYTNAI